MEGSMRIGVLGTGMVGRTIGSSLLRAGQEVLLGSRTRENAGAAEWAGSAGVGASHGTFADAAAFGEVLFNCTSGMASLDALDAAGSENLAGKILIDVANALDFSAGMPPTLAICNTDSLGERIQRRFPAARVVKTLNTMNAQVMVEPGRVPGAHNVFLSGDDGAAKAQVASWLALWFGWPASSVIDLGDMRSARGTEMLLPLWLRLWSALGAADINFHIARA
jgi:8-hydroxy-5-deazaflavin:NADPH oxidoreductase